MENQELINANFDLPVLMPLELNTLFVDKIKGDNKLANNVIMIIAEDKNEIFFVNCLSKTKIDEDLLNDSYIDLINKNGIDYEGNIKEITLCDCVNLNIIYKMNRDEFISKLKENSDNVEKIYPYLSIEDQINMVSNISERLNSENKPKLVWIRKRKKENNIQIAK